MYSPSGYTVRIAAGDAAQGGSAVGAVAQLEESNA
jgi:hypothetical protein